MIKEICKDEGDSDKGHIHVQNGFEGKSEIFGGDKREFEFQL